jgi:hypothetical protein
LPKGQAKQALNSVKSGFLSATVNTQTYWFPDSDSTAMPAVYILPAYDEFIIGYKDKTLSLPFKDQRKTVQKNGVFRPIVVIDGKISGIWKHMVKRGNVIMETNLFQPVEAPTQQALITQAEKLGEFLEQEIEIDIQSEGKKGA